MTGANHIATKICVSVLSPVHNKGGNMAMHDGEKRRRLAMRDRLIAGYGKRRWEREDGAPSLSMHECAQIINAMRSRGWLGWTLETHMITEAYDATRKTS